MLKLNLFENGVDSINHGVKHFAESDYKQAILSVYQGVELLLKESLRRISPELIYTDKKPVHTGSHTVDYKELLNRLRECDLTDDDKADQLKFLRIERNNIQHYEVHLSKEDAEWILGKALNYICVFSSEKLGVEIEDQVSDADWKKIEELVFSYEERDKKAKSRMGDDTPYGKEGSSYTELECPYCLNETILVNLDSKVDEADCYFCHQKATVLECPRCGTKYAIMKEDKAEKQDSPCDACFEREMGR
ncbi:MAG: hypothetical protein WC632_06035 [Candidatus Margulisiibacteriota bacterium]